MRFQLWLFVHLLGVLTFLGAHGVSMFVMFRIRKEHDRGKIAELISLSGETSKPMYVSLLVLVVGGIGAGTSFGLFSKWWMLTALAILLAEVGAMTAIAKPYFKRITEATAIRPSGVPRISDEELAALLGSKEPIAITAIGFAGLLVILWLMVFKPF